jgi:hypothetical protein
VRALFDNQGIHERNHHDGFRGIKTSENALFLYKSNQADSHVRLRLGDYFLAIAPVIFLTGYSNLILLPFIAQALQTPRLMASFYYFTFHAELLPHTE